jgi:uncharacterized protein (TIGR02246 family)
MNFQPESDRKFSEPVNRSRKTENLKPETKPSLVPDPLTDEKAIRELIAGWHAAAQAGDTERVLTMVAEDAIFLTPGRPPIAGREEFAALQRTVAATVRFESAVNIREVVVHGGWAHTWSDLVVTMFPADGPPVRRAGPTLSIFRKEPDGRWVLFRDGNMLAVEKSSVIVTS